MPETASEEVPLLAPDHDSQQRNDGHFVCNIEGPVVRAFDSSFKQQLRELFSLVVYYAQFATLLASVVLLFQAGAWQWATAALVLTALHHILLAVVLMVRNGWVQTAWNYCCGVFMFNPMEGFDFLEEGCIGIIVAGACWLMYLALALMGLGFLSYCLLCYLATALVFSLLLMDISLLAATLLQTASAPLLAPSELLYIENFRVSRLTLLAALQSLPLLLLLPPALAAAYLLPNPPFAAPAGIPPWLAPLSLTLALLSVLDAASLIRQATRASGTTLPLYICYILQLRGAVKVPPALMPAVVRDMIRADGCLRVSNTELDTERWPQVACQLVPGYLLPLDADRLEPCQLVAALREACSAVMEAVGRSNPDSCSRIPMPRLVLEADLGAQHSAEALLLGLRALEGLESISVLGGRLGGPRFWEVGRQMAAHFFLTEMRLADVRLDATALSVLLQLLSGPHCTPLARLEILRSTLPKGRPPGRPPKSTTSSLAAPLLSRSGTSRGSQTDANPSAGGRGRAAARSTPAGSEAGEVEEVWEEGVQASFFSALAGNSTLKYLSMSGTPLEASAVAALCKVLQGPSALTHLDLSFCALGLDGAQTLAAALATAPLALHHLAVAPSDATAVGTAALVRIAQARLRRPPPPAAPQHPPPRAPAPLPEAPPTEPRLLQHCMWLYASSRHAGLLLSTAPHPWDPAACECVSRRLALTRAADGSIETATFDVRDLLAPEATPNQLAAQAAAFVALAARRHPNQFDTFWQQGLAAAGGAPALGPLGPGTAPPFPLGAGEPAAAAAGVAAAGQPPPGQGPESLHPASGVGQGDQQAAGYSGQQLQQRWSQELQPGLSRPPGRPPLFLDPLMPRPQPHRQQPPPPAPLSSTPAPNTPTDPYQQTPEPPSPHNPLGTPRTPPPTQQPLPEPAPGAGATFAMISPGLWHWAAPTLPAPPGRATPPARLDITLRVLDITDTAVPVGGMPGVTFHCLQDYGRLTSGDWLAHAPPAPAGGLTLSLLCFEDALSTLVQGPLLLPGLSCLDFSFVRLSDTHVELLGQSLQACPTLRRLCLFSVDLDDSRMQLLAAALPSARALYTLSLCGNAIGPLGGLALCRAIQDLPRLRFVQLLRNLHPLPIAVLDGLAALMAACPDLKICVVTNGQWGPLPADPAAAGPDPAAGRQQGGASPDAVETAATAAAADAGTAAVAASPPGSAAATTSAPQEMQVAGQGLAGGEGAAEQPALEGEEGAAASGAALDGEEGAAGSGAAVSRPPSSSGGSVSSGGSECGICCDSSDTIAIQACQHHVCASCYRNIHQTSGPRHPFTCPYCRAPISGYRYLRLPPALQSVARDADRPRAQPAALMQALQDALQDLDALAGLGPLLPAAT